MIFPKLFIRAKVLVKPKWDLYKKECLGYFKSGSHYG